MAQIPLLFAGALLLVFVAASIATDGPTAWGTLVWRGLLTVLTLGLVGGLAWLAWTGDATPKLVAVGLVGYVCAFAYAFWRTQDSSSWSMSWRS